MKNLILTLAVLLLAAPAFADVTITLDKLGGGQIAVNYTSDEAELVRAFALDITAIDGNIIDVTDFAIGDDSGGYGIFPGTFASANVQVNPATGQVDDWGVAGYSPVAPAGDPDALGGIGTSGVTIEMGSLYDQAAPGDSGTLCIVTVDENATKLCVTGNAIRGNVVLESAAEVQTLVFPDEAGPGCILLESLPCFPPSFSTYDDWVTYGKPLCWCNSAIDPAGTGDYQCDGDGDGATQGILKRRVYTNDLDLLIPNWGLNIATADPCADYDHKGQGILKRRVYTDDLQKLIDNWAKNDTALGGDCGLLSRPE
jgi:hypothetical protein